ncbi:hypothetical protein BJ741DRAFT_603339 [Chytriomyces cf. hyalinus JEL632]|nr:hypothetical protein BJ741DRAFT_603339 [Chytriomyces cf. hyalinus JEL632]
MSRNEGTELDHFDRLVSIAEQCALDGSPVSIQCVEMDMRVRLRRNMVEKGSDLLEELRQLEESHALKPRNLDVLRSKSVKQSKSVSFSPFESRASLMHAQSMSEYIARVHTSNECQSERIVEDVHEMSEHSDDHAAVAEHSSNSRCDVSLTDAETVDHVEHMDCNAQDDADGLPVVSLEERVEGVSMQAQQVHVEDDIAAETADTHVEQVDEMEDIAVESANNLAPEVNATETAKESANNQTQVDTADLEHEMHIAQMLKELDSDDDADMEVVLPSVSPQKPDSPLPPQSWQPRKSKALEILDQLFSDAAERESEAHSTAPVSTDNYLEVSTQLMRTESNVSANLDLMKVKNLDPESILCPPSSGFLSEVEFGASMAGQELRSDEILADTLLNENNNMLSSPSKSIPSHANLNPSRSKDSTTPPPPLRQESTRNPWPSPRVASTSQSTNQSNSQPIMSLQTQHDPARRYSASFHSGSSPEAHHRPKMVQHSTSARRVLPFSQSSELVYPSSSPPSVDLPKTRSNLEDIPNEPPPGSRKKLRFSKTDTPPLKSSCFKQMYDSFDSEEDDSFDRETQADLTQVEREEATTSLDTETSEFRDMPSPTSAAARNCEMGLYTPQKPLPATKNALSSNRQFQFQPQSQSQNSNHSRSSSCSSPNMSEIGHDILEIAGFVEDDVDLFKGVDLSDL